MLQEIILIIFPVVYSSLYYLYAGHWFCVNLENNITDFFFFQTFSWSFSWSNEFVMIVTKNEQGWWQLINEVLRAKKPAFFYDCFKLIFISYHCY